MPLYTLNHFFLRSIIYNMVKGEENSFELFKEQTTPQSYLRFMTCIFLLYFTLYWTLVFRQSFNYLTIAIAILSIALTLVPSVLLCYLYQTGGDPTRKYLRLLESAIVLGFVLAFSMIHIMRAHYGQCSTLQQDILSFWHCLPALKAGCIISDTSFFLLVMPLPLSIILPHVDLYVIDIALSISSLTTIVSALSLGAVVSMTWIVAAIAFVWLLMYFYHTQRNELYHYSVRYHEEMKTKEAMQDIQSKKLVEEMRNMIASVSHDLKSPLAAFISGVELIRTLLARLPCRDEASRKTLSNVRMVLQSIECSYYLMLMTINRCTDFTKSIHHIPLVPNLELVNVKDVVRLVVHTVSTLQQNTAIHFHSAFDGAIITDKQWLFDNLLCLITNSIKYSSLKGECSVLLAAINATQFTDKQPNPMYAHLSNAMSTFIAGAEDGDHDPNEWLYLEVADLGKGVSDDEASTLFSNPNFTTQRIGGGSGLGLTCLARRVEELQGCYGVSRRPDHARGAVFWFCLPFHQQSSQFSLHQRKYDLNALHLHRPREEDSQHVATDNTPVPCTTEAVLPSSNPATPSPSITGTRSSDATNSYYSTQLPSLKSQSHDGPLTAEDKLSVCVVDDALPILKMLKLHLEGHGHCVTTASNGREALDILFDECDINVSSVMGYHRAPQHNVHETRLDVLHGEHSQQGRRRTFDAVLMDLQMPIVNGIEAIRAIRERESAQMSAADNSEPSPPNRGSRQLIIAMSANSDHVTTQEAFDAGADAFIQKPFRLEKFYEALHNCRSNEPQRVRDREP